MYSGDLFSVIPELDAALATKDDPELQMLRGQIGFVVNDFDAACRHLQASIQGFDATGEPRRAALAAAWMAWVYMDGFGNRIASRGWFARAKRLLEGEGPCVERGWVLVCMIGCSVADVAELEANAVEALAIARSFGERDLEAKALADGGLALVSQGGWRTG